MYNPLTQQNLLQAIKPLLSVCVLFHFASLCERKSTHAMGH